MKKTSSVHTLNSLSVPPLKRLRIASSLVLRNREASALYCPAGHQNFLKLPDRPIVGHLPAGRSGGQGMHGDSDDRPKEQHELTMEMNAVKRILYGAPFLKNSNSLSQ
jgi:hypothetical protein